MTIELAESPFTWDELLEASRVQQEAFWDMPLFRWWRLKEEFSSREITQSARMKLRNQLEENYRLVVAKIDNRIVGYAFWILPDHCCARATILGTAWKYILAFKDLIGNFWDPPISSIDRNKLSIFRREQSICKKNAMGSGHDYYYLDILCVDKNFQRQGIGARLLQWAIERAKEGGDRIYLESSPAGEGLYLKHGFREVDVLTVGGPHCGGGQVCRLPCLVYS